MSINGAFSLAFRASDSGKRLSGGGLFSFLGLGANPEATKANDQSAFTISAFYNGVEQLSNDIAKLPKAVKRKDGINRIDYTDHPVNYLIAAQPNDMMNAFDFWKMIIVLVVIKGNAYCRIVRNRATGKTESILHLENSETEVFKKDNKLYYKYKGEILSSADVLHFKAFTFDGLMGVSLISFAAAQLGTIIDAQNYQGEVYKDRGLGYGVIESDLNVAPANKKAIEEGFSAKMSGQSKFKVPMLDEGMKYKSISISPAEAQFLEANKNGVLEVCRWLNIAPHKLKELGNANYSNIYQQSIEHVQDSLLPWIIRIEQELTNKLFTEKEKTTVYIKFNEKVLLRGDLQARKDYFTAAIYSGFMTRNEVRALEDMNPIEGLDEPLQPVNMQALSLVNELQKQQENGNNAE